LIRLHAFNAIERLAGHVRVVGRDEAVGGKELSVALAPCHTLKKKRCVSLASLSLSLSLSLCVSLASHLFPNTCTAKAKETYNSVKRDLLYILTSCKYSMYL